MNRYAGIDMVSCTTKVVVVVDGDDNIVGCHVLRSGIDYRGVAHEALNVVGNIFIQLSSLKKPLYVASLNSG